MKCIAHPVADAWEILDPPRPRPLSPGSGHLLTGRVRREGRPISKKVTGVEVSVITDDFLEVRCLLMTAVLDCRLYATLCAQHGRTSSPRLILTASPANPDPSPRRLLSMRLKPPPSLHRFLP
jgi:hypothetical protein